MLTLSWPQARRPYLTASLWTLLVCYCRLPITATSGMTMSIKLIRDRYCQLINKRTTETAMLRGHNQTILANTFLIAKAKFN